ncbi:MAG: OmpW/AlkL family protein [Alphaproteobacteria bacterium]
MKTASKYVLMAGVACMTFAAMPAQAKDLGEGIWAKERFQVRLRGIGVFANGDGIVDGTSLGTSVDNSYVPEVDLTYFFTENIAAELIAATAKHSVSAGGSKLGDTWILPPTLTLQYHFTPDNKFSPYVGAGINYSLFYGESDADGFSDLDVGNGVGFALQAGFDYWINDNWGLNLDAKYIDLDIDVGVANGTLNAYDVDIDPWIIGAGVSYRF